VGQRSSEDAKVRIIIKKSESSLEADVRIIDEDPRHHWADYRMLADLLQVEGNRGRLNDYHCG
jgi:hypothetical protein